MKILKCHICKSVPLIIKEPYVTVDGKKKCEYSLECPLCRDTRGNKNGTFRFGSKVTAIKRWNDMVSRNKGETIENCWPMWLKKKLNRYK